MKQTRIQLCGALLFLLWVGELIVFFLGPFGMESTQKTPMDFLFLLLIALHAFWWLLFFRKKEKTLYRILFRLPETLFAVTTVLFLFSYIYASNANMDYIQRFAESSGNLRLAPDSATERLNSLLRYLPFMLYQLFILIYFRISKRRFLRQKSGTASFFSTWGILLALVSSFLYAVSQPSFLRLDGLPVLAWICMVPVLAAVFTSSRGRAVFYGMFFGVVQTMLSNYWLGTFSLITLQFITIYYLIIYTLFMTVLVYLAKPPEQTAGKPRSGLSILQVFAVPVLWTAFDFLRSLAFMGYPWNMLGTSQYGFTPFIQVASLTGVWGVSFLVYGANTVIAFIILEWKNLGIGKSRSSILTSRLIQVAGGFSILIVLVIAGGLIHLGLNPKQQDNASEAGDNTVTVALIQQNTDPRKDNYEDGLEVLQRLTDQAMEYGPDLVAWSETAFVPNIRRWSQEDPDKNYYAGLVDRLLTYQKRLGTWLLTGNDDYFLIESEDGEEVRHDYNASILFSPGGERVATYHKMHLVPFTEFFPFKEQMPWLYDLLINFDVNLWTPGDIPLVFEHPKFRFSTPICFEDSFPSDVRRFITAGADVILNLSNDFWSLTNVEAKQHYVNALFRAVENRRHFLRATASGVTTHIDPQGRPIEFLPYYEEGFLIAELPELSPRRSLYTLAGDWFPYFCLICIAGLFIFQATAAMRGSGAGGRNKNPE